MKKLTKAIISGILLVLVSVTLTGCQEKDPTKFSDKRLEEIGNVALKGFISDYNSQGIKDTILENYKITKKSFFYDKARNKLIVGFMTKGSKEIDYFAIQDKEEEYDKFKSYDNDKFYNEFGANFQPFRTFDY